MKIKQPILILTLAFSVSILNGQGITLDSAKTVQTTIVKQNNTLLHTMDSLQHQNDELKKEIVNQTFKIDTLIQQQNNSGFHYFKDFINPIILSVVAGIIFWLIFSFLPERKRLKKLRPKLDLDIYQAYMNLFFLIDLVMRPNGHSPSDYQQRIKGNKLTKDDLELGLQDKCLNETYLYDNNVSKALMPIGKSLFDRASEIDLNIENLYSFSNYLTADEILLLEKIRKKLKVYDLNNYGRSAISLIGGMELKPVNPSLSYMAQNLYELYILFIQLQKLVYNNSYSDRDIFISEVQHYYYSDQFAKCKQATSTGIIKYPKDKNFLEFYSFMSEYKLGKTESAYLKLENILKDKPHLVSNRSFLSDFLNDKKVSSLIEKLYSEKEISELKEVLNRENFNEKNYIEKANKLKKYYADKTEATEAKNKL
jgi:hypothetical protein